MPADEVPPEMKQSGLPGLASGAACLLIGMEWTPFGGDHIIGEKPYGEGIGDSPVIDVFCGVFGVMDTSTLLIGVSSGPYCFAPGKALITIGLTGNSSDIAPAFWTTAKLA